ncbi:hypothetical protein OEZ85_004829 [Tetradesmus obliquus]|uniref:Uncharacterized protein n=1 Tax=Tetradesmus obliquus TaxID=3088 RepID=A0ABY8UGN1_TETOB|nr:hypothetical protein OEZ85_004829 [Tetradesmus obliquus]
MDDTVYGIFGTKLDDGSYTRAADGSWPYALLNHKGNDLTYRPQEHLLNNLKSCGLGRRQEREHFIARCVTDMQLVPWTVEAKMGFRSGICRGRGPFRYRYWLQHVNGTQEEAWSGVGGDELMPVLREAVQEWRRATQPNVPAAAAQAAPGDVEAAAPAVPERQGSRRATTLHCKSIDIALVSDRAMVDLMSNVAQMERERAKTERDRNDKVLRLVMYGVDVLKGGAGAAGGPGLLPGGNLQALPAGMAGARLVEEEAD